MSGTTILFRTYSALRHMVPCMHAPFPSCFNPDSCSLFFCTYLIIRIAQKVMQRPIARLRTYTRTYFQPVVIEVNYPTCFRYCNAGLRALDGTRQTPQLAPGTCLTVPFRKALIPPPPSGIKGRQPQGNKPRPRQAHRGAAQGATSASKAPAA